MKVEELFEHTNATFSEFCGGFRVVNEFNLNDVALVSGYGGVGELEEALGLNSDKLLGQLFDIGVFDSYGEDREVVSIIGHEAFAALCRLREEDQKEVLAGLEVEESFVMFEAGGCLFPKPLLEYLQPGGEGGTQVSLEDWTIWSMLKLVEDIRGWNKFYGHRLYTGTGD